MGAGGNLNTIGGLASFGGSLLSGFINSHKFLTLFSAGHCFRGVVTFGSLRYTARY